MNRDRHKRLYDQHTWIGLLLGLFIYVVSFTGTVAIFIDELKPWENPAYRGAIPEKPIAFEPLFQTFLQEAKKQNISTNDIRINFPSHTSPYYQVDIRYRDKRKKRQKLTRRWDAVSGRFLPERGKGLSYWLQNFHRNLMLPRIIGRTLVGISGIFMLLACVGGVLIHGKLVADFFTLRLQRSQRLKWQDSHNVLGLFGLPFSLIIAFTGAALGVFIILSQLVALVAFQGSPPVSMFKNMHGAPVKASGVKSPMISIDELMKRRHPDTDHGADWARLRQYGDQNAEFAVFFVADRKLTNRVSVKLRGASGKWINSPDGAVHPKPANRVVRAMIPLHFGSFGGIFLKWLYALLGTALCIMIATGSLLWVERRQYGSAGNKSDRFYSFVSRTNIGVFMGFPLATIALFLHDKLYLGAESARIYWTGMTYFTVVLGVMLFAFSQSNGYKSTKLLMYLSGTLLLVIPIVNSVTTGAVFWSTHAAIGERISNSVDVSLLFLGILTLISATQIPLERITRKKRSLNSDHSMHGVPAE